MVGLRSGKTEPKGSQGVRHVQREDRIAFAVARARRNAGAAHARRSVGRNRPGVGR